MSTPLPDSFGIFRAKASRAIEKFNVTSIALKAGRLVFATFEGGIPASQANYRGLFGVTTNDNRSDT